MQAILCAKSSRFKRNFPQTPNSASRLRASLGGLEKNPFFCCCWRAGKKRKESRSLVCAALPVAGSAGRTGIALLPPLAAQIDSQPLSGRPHGHTKNHIFCRCRYVRKAGIPTRDALGSHRQERQPCLLYSNFLCAAPPFLRE